MRKATRKSTHPQIHELEKEFGIYMPSNEMAPRFNQDDLIVVSTVAPACPGDDVMIALRPKGAANPKYLVRRLVSETPSTLRLRQFNPPKIAKLPRSRVRAVYKIVPLHEFLCVPVDEGLQAALERGAVNPL